MPRWALQVLLVALLLTVATTTGLDAQSRPQAALSKSAAVGSTLLPRSASLGGPSPTIGAPTVDAYGIKTYQLTSQFLGPSPTVVRVVEPTNPAPGMPRRVLFVLPVEQGKPDLASEFGDGLDELQRLDVQNRYNAVLIAPSFNITPWYADHDANPDRRLESFIVRDLVSFGDSFGQPGEICQRWLVGFSKSGFGALSLILRHPDVFSAAAVWDAPVELEDMSMGMGIPENFGSEENFDRYEIPRLLAANAEAFKSSYRLWIGLDTSSWTAHMRQLDVQMNQLGILHGVSSSGGVRLHAWYSGWLEEAVRFLAEKTVAASPPRDVARMSALVAGS